MSLEESVEFLQRRTGAVPRDPDERAALQELAKELDGFPLALEQAAAYVSKINCSFGSYLQAFRKQGLRVLESSRPATGPYERSVATTWSLNFEAVRSASSTSAELLYFAAFLAPERIPKALLYIGGRWLGPGLATVCSKLAEEPLGFDELLAPLTKYSLIFRDRGSDSFSVHRLVQMVVRDNLAEDHKRRWAECSVKAVAQALPKIEAAQWDLAKALYPHAAVCVRHVEEFDFASGEVVVFLNTFGRHLRKQGQFSEARRAHELALNIARRLHGTTHVDTASSLKCLADVCHAMRLEDDAEGYHKMALALREQLLGPEHHDVSHTPPCQHG